MKRKHKVTITLEELAPNHWKAECDDILWNGYAVHVSEITPSWALSHACEMIVEALNEQRDSGKDWKADDSDTIGGA